MTTIYTKTLTKENFSKYGSFENLFNPETMGIGVGSPSAFFPDVLPLNFGARQNASISVCHVAKRDMVIDNYEYHNLCCEGILPINADIVIFAGLGFPPLVPVQLEAFVVPKGTAVSLKPGVLHGTQFPVDGEHAAVLILLPERTFATDFHFTQLNDEEKITICLG